MKDTPEYCTACETGQLGLLGVLGHTEHVQCRDCGAEFSRPLYTAQDLADARGDYEYDRMRDEQEFGY